MDYRSANTRITLVQCGENKRNKRSPAWRLYTSTPFEKSMTAAMVTGQPSILSAEHGLVQPSTRLDSYDTSMNDLDDAETAQWGRDVLSSIPTHVEELVFYAGVDYTEPLLKAIDNSDREFEVWFPYANCSGNGQQMAVAGTITDAMENGATFSEAIRKGESIYA